LCETHCGFSLQAIAAGELASLAAVDFSDVYIQISGGVDHTTLALAKNLGVNIAGVGIGKYSLIALQPEVEDFHGPWSRVAPAVISKAQEFMRAVRSGSTLVALLLD
jgi:hypothetical protein